MKVIVSGGRDITDRAYVFENLSRIHAERPITCVIEGGQRAYDERGFIIGGVDYWASEWAKAHSIPTIREDADWTKYGKYAGPMRNQAMIDKYAPDAVILFRGNRGTNDMRARATACHLQKIEVYR